MQKIAQLPSIIVQGRYDAICFPEIAYSLYQNWKGSNLWMIPNGGHSDDQPPMMSALVAATIFFIKNLEELNYTHDINSSIQTESFEPITAEAVLP